MSFQKLNSAPILKPKNTACLTNSIMQLNKFDEDTQCAQSSKKRKRTRIGTHEPNFRPLTATKILHYPGKSSTTNNKIMSHVIFYAILDSNTNVTVDIPCDEKRFAVTAENSYACKRIGPIPKNPTLLLIQEGDRKFVQELADRKDIYGDYSNWQQTKARRLHPQSIATESRLHKFAAQLAPHKLNNRSFFAAKTWFSLMETLLQEKPTPSVKRSEGAKQLFHAIRKTLDSLNVKQLMLSALGDSATASHRAPVENLVVKLEHDLTKLFKLDFVKYGNAFKEELAAYGQIRNNAIGAALTDDSDVIMKDVAVNNLHSKVDYVKNQVANHFAEMSKLQGTIAQTAIEVMTDAESSWTKSLHPYSLSPSDLQGDLDTSEADISIEPCNACGMEHVCKDVSKALQLLVACQKNTNGLSKEEWLEKRKHFEAISSSGWLKKRLNKIVTFAGKYRKQKKLDTPHMSIRLDLMKLHHDSTLSSFPTSSSSSSSTSSYKNEWESFRVSIQQYVLENAPSNEHDINKQLLGNLKEWGGYTIQKDWSKGTNISKWHDPEYQKIILQKGLQGLWLLARTSVAFDGTAESFIKIFLYSEFGDPLIRTYIAWRSVVTKLLNDAIRTPQWITPQIATTVQPELAAQTDKVIFGPEPLKISLEYLWLRRLLEFRQYPTEAIKKVACARLIMFIFTEAVVLKYGCRVHCTEKIGIVTVEQFESLAPKNWDYKELQYGLWIVHSNTSIKLIINDSKKIESTSGKKRDQQTYDDFHYEDEIMTNGVFQTPNSWFEKMYHSIRWAYDVLAPKNRLYTTNIWDKSKKSWREAPIYYCPTPMSPNSSLQLIKIDQSRYKTPEGEPYKTYKELVTAAKTATGIQNRKVINDPVLLASLEAAGITIPPFPSRVDKTFHQGSTAGNSSDTQSMYNVQMVDLMKQFGSPTFKMRRVGRYGWKLDAYQKEKAKMIKQYTFEKSFDHKKDIVGSQKLFGGHFDEYDVDSLKTISTGAKSGKLLYDLKAARHSNIAQYVWAQDLLAKFISHGKVTKKQKKDKVQRMLHPLESCFENAHAVLLEKEVHFSTDTVDTSYCDMMHRCVVCQVDQAMKLCMIDEEKTYLIKKLIWSHPVMKNNEGLFREDAIDIGGRGITYWPTTMTPSCATEEHKNMSILQKCHNFQLLSEMEQIEVLWTMSAMRTFLNILHDEYDSFCDNKELTKLWDFVREISTPPGGGRAKSPRKKKEER